MKQVGDIIPLKDSVTGNMVYYRIVEANEDGVKLEPCTKKEAVEQMADLAERRQLSEACDKALHFKAVWM